MMLCWRGVYVGHSISNSSFLPQLNSCAPLVWGSWVEGPDHNKARAGQLSGFYGCLTFWKVCRHVWIRRRLKTPVLPLLSSPLLAWVLVPSTATKSVICFAFLCHPCSPALLFRPRSGPLFIGSLGGSESEGTLGTPAALGGKEKGRQLLLLRPIFCVVGTLQVLLQRNPLPSPHPLLSFSFSACPTPHASPCLSNCCCFFFISLCHHHSLYQAFAVGSDECFVSVQVSNPRLNLWLPPACPKKKRNPQSANTNGWRISLRKKTRGGDHELSERAANASWRIAMVTVPLLGRTHSWAEQRLSGVFITVTNCF